MKKSNPMMRRILRLSCLLTILVSSFSCTYDYFVDETNFYIYVPQIQDGDIDDFTVVLFDMSGNARFSRQYTKADIEANESLKKDGIIKVRILPGEYNVSCFSGSRDADPPLNVELNSRSDNSYVSLFPIQGQSSYYSPSANFQIIEGGLKHIKAPFIGQKFERDGITPVQDTVTVRVEPYWGNIYVKIKGLTPTNYDRIQLITKGLSTRWRMDNSPSTYTDADKVLATYKLPTTSSSNLIEFHHQYFPSADGANLSALLQIVSADNSTINVDISEADFRLKSNGSVITRLNPREDIIITLDSIFLMSIDLKGWSTDIKVTDPGDADM